MIEGSPKVMLRLGRFFDFNGMYKAYQTVFRTPSGIDFVMPDLLDFTGALAEAPRSDNMFEQGRAAGRRDVWLHVNEYVQLTEQERYALWQGRASMRRQDFQRR